MTKQELSCLCVVLSGLRNLDCPQTCQPFLSKGKSLELYKLQFTSEIWHAWVCTQAEAVLILAVHLFTHVNLDKYGLLFNSIKFKMQLDDPLLALFSILQLYFHVMQFFLLHHYGPLWWSRGLAEPSCQSWTWCAHLSWVARESTRSLVMFFICCCVKAAKQASPAAEGHLKYLGLCFSDLDKERKNLLVQLSGLWCPELPEVFWQRMSGPLMCLDVQTQ